MKKVTASAGALVLAGIGSIALAGPAGAQSVEDIPSYPAVPLEADTSSSGLRGEVQLGNPGFDNATLHSTDSAPCPVVENETLLAGVAIEVWGFDADGEPQLLDEGYSVSEMDTLDEEHDFWGGDPSQYISDEERARWSVHARTPEDAWGTFANTGAVQLNFNPPAVNGEQTVIAHCLVVDADWEMEGSLDDLERSDEALVGTYTVTGGENPGGDDGDGDTPPATEPPADTDDGEDDEGDDGDDVTTPAPTPVTGDPSLTG